MSSAGPPDPAAARMAALDAAYRGACLTELRALKPGNVHVFGDGHNMTVADFEASAAASAAPLCATGDGVGSRVLNAVRATLRAVGCNTNLGIILLAAPLIKAAETAPPGRLRETLATVLDRLTVADATCAYEAIRLARPAGLGRAEAEDVGSPPTVDLKQAMLFAADRDGIARQYATVYADVFDLGLARIADAIASGDSREWAATHAYLAILAAAPDGHIRRKLGAHVAESVRDEARRVLAALGRGRDREQRTAILLAFDRELKARGINPGTSADLTVASLLSFDIVSIIASAVSRQ